MDSCIRFLASQLSQSCTRCIIDCLRTMQIPDRLHRSSGQLYWTCVRTRMSASTCRIYPSCTKGYASCVKIRLPPGSLQFVTLEPVLSSSVCSALAIWSTTSIRQGMHSGSHGKSPVWFCTPGVSTHFALNLPELAWLSQACIFFLPHGL